MTTTVNTDDAEAATAAAAVIVEARAPSPQPNERRMAKETGEDSYRESMGNKNACCLSLELGVVDTAGHIYYCCFCIMHVYLVRSAGKKAYRAFRLISHIPPRFQAS